MPLFKPGPGTAPEFFSSQEAFEKVCASFEKYDHGLVLVTQPEVSSRYCGREGIAATYSPVTQLGILNGSPAMSSDFGPIILPMEQHISGLRGYGKLEIVSSPIKFHCVDPENVSISRRYDELGKRNNIEIYLDETAIEIQFSDRSAIRYHHAINLLGEEESSSYWREHEEVIQQARLKFLKDLKKTIRRDIGCDEGTTELSQTQLKEFNQATNEWGLTNNYTLKFKDGVNVDLRQFLEARLE